MKWTRRRQQEIVQ